MHQQLILKNRTDSLLEYYEDAPDDDANWGNIISTEKKLYKTESDSDSSDSEHEMDKSMKEMFEEVEAVKKEVGKLTLAAPNASRATTARYSLN